MYSAILQLLNNVILYYYHVNNAMPRPEQWLEHCHLAMLEFYDFFPHSVSLISFPSLTFHRTFAQHSEPCICTRNLPYFCY